MKEMLFQKTKNRYNDYIRNKKQRKYKKQEYYSHMSINEMNTMAIKFALKFGITTVILLYGTAFLVVRYYK